MNSVVFIYELAQEKMASGNYTGAVYVLKEIIKYQPIIMQTQHRCWRNARQHKKEQLFRLFTSLGGAILFIGIGSTAGCCETTCGCSPLELSVC